MRKGLVEFVPGLVGGALGGLLGYSIVSWISRQGYYAPVIPGALTGLACGFFSCVSSNLRGFLCTILAASIGLFSQWKVLMRRVETDGSFLDFLAHLHTEEPIPLIMLGLGTFLGYWWGREATFPWRNRFRTPGDAD